MLKDLILTLNMVGSGSKLYDIPPGYSYMTILNTSDNNITAYLGSDTNSPLIFIWNLYTGQTVPMKAGTEVFIQWVDGDSNQQPKPVQVVFSENNLGVSTTFGNPAGSSNVNISSDAAGIAKDATLTNGNQKTQVTNFPATQTVAGTVSVGNFPSTQATEENGWTWTKITAAAAGDVTVKGTAGKVSQMTPDASEVVYLKDGTTQAWKTGAFQSYGLPLACAASIVINFAAAGSAWILYK